MTPENKQSASRPTQKRMPRLKAWRSALEQMDYSQTEQFLVSAQGIYDRLYASSTPEQNPALRRHLEENILTGLALYQALLGLDYDQEEAVELVRELFKQVTRPNRLFFEFLGRTPLIYYLTRWSVRRFMESNFPAAGWQVEWVELNSDRVAFNMHSCYYVDVLNRFDTPELVPLFCDLDDYLYEGVSKYMRWDRTQTIGRGNDYCDLCFSRVHNR